MHAIIPRYVWTHLFLECHDLEGIDMTSPESMTDEHLLSILTSHDKGIADNQEHVVQGRTGLNIWFSLLQIFHKQFLQIGTLLFKRFV